MGTIKVSVPDDKEEKFRKAAMNVFGHKRGSISKAGEHAIEQWVERMNFENEDDAEGLGSFLQGKISGTDKSAVELQEELGDAYEDEILD